MQSIHSTLDQAWRARSTHLYVRVVSPLKRTSIYMITIQSMLPAGTQLHDLPADIQDNLRDLHRRVAALEAASGLHFEPTSGLRTMARHQAIYAEINAKRAKKNLAPLRVPLGSRHLYGQAVDIWDPKGKLKQWCAANVQKLADQGIYCEAFEATPTWVHMQSRAPKSGNRFFKPC